MRWAVVVLGIAALLAGCGTGPHPYIQAGHPPGQIPGGTPSDRTGGARNVPDGVGGAPGKAAFPMDGY
jgi:hypothetical protein